MKKETIKTGVDGLLNNSNRYSTEKGEISMIKPCVATSQTYEIYCIKGDLFDGIERYSTIEEVEARINELLN